MNYKFCKIASKAWLFFLDLIFPVECLGCGQEGQWLCSECLKKIKLKDKQYCLHCKKENQFGQFCAPPARLDDASRSGWCGVNYSLDGVWVAALYDEKLVAEAIKSFKYRFIFDLSENLSKLLIISINNLLSQARISGAGLVAGLDWRDFKKAREMPLALLNFKENLIMPVPLAKKRLRWRGFNQSELLAERFAVYYNLEINKSSLIRLKHKKPQAKLSEKERLENVKNCFAWQGDNLNGRNIILIDDVATTGSTLNQCAKVLKAAGAGEVWGLAVAKG